ncbi:AmmeMemoRadiSam system radical SAM enzyme [Benzoatithermus flavus]
MTDLDHERHPARHWHVLPDGRIQCDVCPRFCKLHDGQRGLCFVRARDGDRLVLTTYGRSSGFCIDPIEKKPLAHFLPGTPVLSFGTAGCNLTCKFCQNWDISKARAFDRLMDRADPEAIAEAALRTGCRSVAYTYNDPVIFLEYAVDVARACRARGIKNVAVTAGYVCAEARNELFELMDAANVDLKAFTEGFYHRLCTASLEPVKETLVWLKHETGVWLELTTLLIPDENDGDAEIEDLSRWVKEALGPDVPLHFTAFHPDWKMLDKAPTSKTTLQRARAIARRQGLRYVYTGNIRDPEGQSTRCHGCGTLLIGRDWHEITSWTLDAAGRCRACGEACAGVFEPRPGDWGSRRQPVTIQRHRGATARSASSASAASAGATATG